MRRVWSAIGLLISCTFPHYREGPAPQGSAGTAAGAGAAAGSGGASTLEAGSPSLGEAGVPALAHGKPVLFLSEAEVAAIRARLQDEPWHEALARVVADADMALTKSPRSVVDNGAPAANPGDASRFGTDDPSQNREDYLSALDMENWIRSLSMAYAFTGDERYAERSVMLLWHWFVSDATRMYPSAQNFGPHTPGAGVPTSKAELWITLPAMFYGSTLVTGHPAWATHGVNAEAEYRQWVAAFLLDLAERQPTTFDASYAWWLMARMAAAALVQSPEQLSMAFDDWRDKASRQIDAQGNLSLDANTSFGQVAFGMKALILSAEIARHNGAQLYEYEDPYGGSALRRAALKQAAYNLDGSTWVGAGPPTANDLGELAPVYELAYSHWQESALLSALELAGRPTFDLRVLGWSTLTHGNLFELGLAP